MTLDTKNTAPTNNTPTDNTPTNTEAASHRDEYTVYLRYLRERIVSLAIQASDRLNLTEPLIDTAASIEEYVLHGVQEAPSTETPSTETNQHSHMVETTETEIRFYDLGDISGEETGDPIEDAIRKAVRKIAELRGAEDAKDADQTAQPKDADCVCHRLAAHFAGNGEYVEFDWKTR